MTVWLIPEVQQLLQELHRRAHHRVTLVGDADELGVGVSGRFGSRNGVSFARGGNGGPFPF